MGCAPSATAAAATSPRASLADDKKASDGIQVVVAAAAGGADTRQLDMSATDSKSTRVNGDVPLTKASSSQRRPS